MCFLRDLGIRITTSPHVSFPRLSSEPFERCLGSDLHVHDGRGGLKRSFGTLARESAPWKAPRKVQDRHLGWPRICSTLLQYYPSSFFCRACVLSSSHGLCSTPCFKLSQTADSSHFAHASKIDKGKGNQQLPFTGIISAAHDRVVAGLITRWKHFDLW